MKSVLATALQYARPPAATKVPAAPSVQRQPVTPQPTRHDKRDPATGQYCE